MQFHRLGFKCNTELYAISKGAGGGSSLLPTLYHQGVLGPKKVEESNGVKWLWRAWSLWLDCSEINMKCWAATPSLCELQEIQPDSNSLYLKLEIWSLEETYSACNIY